MSAGIYIMTPTGLRPAATVPGPPGADGTDSGGGASAITDLTDVNITSPTTNQVLGYDGAEWANQDVPTPTKADLGLDQVNNTSDANKPVSTAQQTALNLKAPLASPTFTGTVGGIDKTMVGLSNVDNTSDINKPISTATQTALNAKATPADITAASTADRDRANHTGTQPISTVTGLQTALDSAGAVKTVAGKTGDVELLTSDISTFVIPEIGEAVYGGYLAGIVDTTVGNIIAADASQTGQKYLLIVSPKSLETTLTMRTTSAEPVGAASTLWDGLTATKAMAADAAVYPAADYCNGLTYPSDTGSQWYLPAMDELELIYRNLKATTETNSTARYQGAAFPGGDHYSGVNPSSSPTGTVYTSTVPTQTQVSLFKDGGGQNLGTAGNNSEYWSATASRTASPGSWGQNFANSTGGYQSPDIVTASHLVRPVRRVLIQNTARLDQALATKADVIDNSVTLVSATDQVASYTTEDDNTSTAGWPNRFQWMFKPFGGVAKLVQWFNEYGEWRGIPAKSNTVGWRLFIKDAPGDPARSANAWEICDNRTDRNVIAAVDDNGLTAKNINRRVETNPTGTAVPAGLPDGTLWIEYDPS